VSAVIVTGRSVILSFTSMVSLLFPDSSVQASARKRFIPSRRILQTAATHAQYGRL
jgi:hypothetical protein